MEKSLANGNFMKALLVIIFCFYSIDIVAQVKFSNNLAKIYECLDTLFIIDKNTNKELKSKVYALTIYDLNDTCLNFQIDEISDTVTLKYEYGYIGKYFMYKNRFILLSISSKIKNEFDILRGFKASYIANTSVRKKIYTSLFLPTYYYESNNILKFNECKSIIYYYTIKKRKIN